MRCHCTPTGYSLNMPAQRLPSRRSSGVSSAFRKARTSLRKASSALLNTNAMGSPLRAGRARLARHAPHHSGPVVSGARSSCDSSRYTVQGYRPNGRFDSPEALSTGEWLGCDDNTQRREMPDDSLPGGIRHQTIMILTCMHWARYLTMEIDSFGY